MLICIRVRPHRTPKPQDVADAIARPHIVRTPESQCGMGDRPTCCRDKLGGGKPGEHRSKLGRLAVQRCGCHLCVCGISDELKGEKAPFPKIQVLIG